MNGGVYEEMTLSYIDMSEVSKRNESLSEIYLFEKSSSVVAFLEIIWHVSV